MGPTGTGGGAGGLEGAIRSIARGAVAAQLDARGARPNPGITT